jgi:hypothetical protein
MSQISEKRMAKFWEELPVRITFDENGCWVWQGAVSSLGYPVIGHRGEQWLVSRIVIGLEKGDEICALHICDNRRCINPNHLYKGSRRENMIDRWHGHSKRHVKMLQ